MRSTTVLLSVVATVGRRAGGGRWFRLPERIRCEQIAADVATAAAIGDRGGR